MLMTRSSTLGDRPSRRGLAWLTALLFATLPTLAHGQTPTTVTIRTTQPVTLVQPQLRPAVPLPRATPSISQPVLPGAGRVAPTLAPGALPSIAVSPTPAAPSVIRPPSGGRSAAAAGLGRLVTPGSESADVVVARIGIAPSAASAALTADFDGDGLIAFEIAPGLVDAPADPGDGMPDGLVGRHVAMGTGTADQVLDGVINVVGVMPAATVEIAGDAVVLGALLPSGPAEPIDTVSVEPGTDMPGTQPEGCLVRFCPRPDPAPGPNRDNELGDVLSFTGYRRPPTPEAPMSADLDDLVDVSILLPLRGREDRGDQFSNYGNEEIW